MPVTQATKEEIVVRFYAVGSNPADAFVNGFNYEKLSDAVFDHQINGGNVYTTVKSFKLEDITDITPTK